MSRRKNRAKSPPFLMVPRYLYRSAAFQSLDGNARAIFLELLNRYNGQNNGMIGLGSREAGAIFGRGNDTGARGLEMLVDRGLIAVASDSTFGQKRLVREWRLTHLPDDRTGHGATKDFMKWDREKQNIVAPVRNIGAQVRLSGNGVPKTQRNSRMGATVSAKVSPSQSHRCDTSRSTISPEQQSGALRGSVSPDPSEAQERRERQHTTSDAPAPAPDLAVRPDGTVQVAEVLPDFLRRRPGAQSIPEPSEASQERKTALSPQDYLNAKFGAGAPETEQI